VQNTVVVASLPYRGGQDNPEQNLPGLDTGRRSSTPRYIVDDAISRNRTRSWARPAWASSPTVIPVKPGLRAGTRRHAYTLALGLKKPEHRGHAESHYQYDPRLITPWAAWWPRRSRRGPGLADLGQTRAAGHGGIAHLQVRSPTVPPPVQNLLHGAPSFGVSHPATAGVLPAASWEDASHPSRTPTTSSSTTRSSPRRWRPGSLNRFFFSSGRSLARPATSPEARAPQLRGVVGAVNGSGWLSKRPLFRGLGIVGILRAAASLEGSPELRLPRAAQEPHGVKGGATHNPIAQTMA